MQSIISTDLIREPVLLSLLFFLLLSFSPCENIQDLVSDILLLFRILLLGLAAPKFQNLSASSVDLIPSHRKGWRAPYPVLETMPSRWL